jgi:hypothetical protein
MSRNEETSSSHWWTFVIVFSTFMYTSCLDCDGSRRKGEDLEHQNSLLKMRVDTLESDNSTCKAETSSLQRRLDNVQNRVFHLELEEDATRRAIVLGAPLTLSQ